jgi:hypothetical protein
MPFVFSHVEYCDMHYLYGFCDGNARAAVDKYQRRFSDGRIPSRGVLVVFQVLLCGLKGRWCHRLTFLRWFREVHDFPLVELPLASVCHICRCGELYMRKIYILIIITGYNICNQRIWIRATG